MTLSKSFVLKVASVLAFVLLSSCIKNSSELGSEKNPIKLHFVPSVDAKVIENNSKIFKDYLEKETGLKYEVTIPQSYVAVVEAFGTKRADIAAINTFGYMLAHEKYGAEAKLTVIRHGLSTYQGMIVAKTDSKIKKIEDLADKKVAYVDPASTSGYLLPLKMLKDKGVTPKETVFALKHDNVISMVYQGQVDAGAAFFSPTHKDDQGVEQIEDARRLVKTQYPDVEKKISIIGMSDSIPNDPFIFRKELSEELKTKIVDAMLKFVETKEGQDAFKAIYGVTALKKSTDADYDSVRTMLKTVGVNAADLMKK
jgi:phosphonate transport system substrate-binding protein